MTKRQSIYIEAFPHANPVPAASRIGQMLYSGVIYGREGATQQVPASLERQCELMFGHLQSIVSAAGGTLDDVIKVTLWMVDKTQRAVVNPYWEALFPDAASRPARHTLESTSSGNILIQCDFVAVLSD